MTASSNVLLAPCAFLALTFGVALLVRARPDWVRFALLLPCAIAFTATLSPLVGSLIAPRFLGENGSVMQYAAKLLYAAWWLLLARVAIAGGRLLLGIDRSQKAMHLASDFVAVALYLAAALAILDFVFGISVTGLLATSGIIAIVLGLALQSTLSDLFSGMAIGIDRSFKIGDVISLEGVTDGRVVEASWRSIRLATAAGAMATVPNSTVAKSRILNRTSPRDLQGGFIRVVVDPAALPSEVVEALKAAYLNAFPRAENADTVVTCVELKGEGTTYQVGFSARLPDFDTARSSLLLQVSRHLRYAGLALAPQDGTALTPRPLPRLEQRLREVPLFQVLSSDEMADLVSGVVEHRGQAGSAMFEQGGNKASMYVVARGVFGVERDDGAGPRRLGTVGPGDYFGELALLTGIANPATVRALTPFVSLEVQKATVAPLLESNPDLLRAFEEAAAKAGNLLERTIAEASAIATPDLPLLLRIAGFFDLKSIAVRQRPVPIAEPATRTPATEVRNR